MRKVFLHAAAVMIACAATTWAAGAGPAGTAGPALDGGSLTLLLEAGPYRIVEAPGGQRVELQGFDFLKRPGMPMLPQRISLVLLPPGARFQSLEVEPLGSELLEGDYRIEPTPAMLPLVDPEHEAEGIDRAMDAWQASYRAAYATDEAYPAQVVEAVGSGSLRKYNFVRLAFRPFTWHAVSGRLMRHPAARVRVLYSLPASRSSAAPSARALAGDTLADGRAADLFINYADLKGLYKPGNPNIEGTEHHDYVIITTAALSDAVTGSEFPSWKASLGFDLRLVLVTDPEIADQPGRDLAERIRNFLRANYAEWGIEYLLLVGNESVPMRYCYPDPENHVHNPWDPGLGAGSVPTDAYYADLSFADQESWDSDGDGFPGEYGQDSPDFLPEIYVGRIPTDSPERVTYTLNKLVRVEQDTGEWKHHALQGGAVLFYEGQDHREELPMRDGAVCMDMIQNDVMSGWSVSRYSERAGLVPSSFVWPALTQSAFVSDWRDNAYGVVNWAGHGSPSAAGRVAWMGDDGDGIPETDGSDWMEWECFIGDWLPLDDDYPSIVTAVSCNVGYPEDIGQGNLGVRLLTDPQLGAGAGVFSSTRYAYVTLDWPQTRGGAESFCYQFNRHLIGGAGAPLRLGEAVYEAKSFTHLNSPFDFHAEFRDLFNYNLYGDPAMDWRGVETRVLMRNAEITALSPPSPPLGEVLPLDPVEDLYLQHFASGGLDVEPAAGSPLVLYGVDGPASLRLVKTPAGALRIVY